MTIKYFLGSYEKQLSYSTDLTTWTDISFAGFGYIRGVCWNSTQTMFLCASQSSSNGFPVAYSTDGLNWSSAIFNQYYTAYSCCSNGSNFVVACGNGLFHSTNGITWTNQGNPFSSGSPRCVIWDIFNSQYIAASENQIATSVNGLSWTLRGSTGGIIDYIAYNNSAIATDGTTIVVAGQAGNSTIAVSTDNGVTWTGKGKPTDGIQDMAGVCWTGSQFVACGGGSGATPNNIAYSSNGVAWSSNIIADFLPSSICYDGTNIVVASTWQNPNRTYAYATNPASTWTVGNNNNHNNYTVNAYTLLVLTTTDPIFSLSSGTYYSSQTLTLSCVTPLASIHYTLNGDIPDALSPVYSTPLSINQSQTVKAIAIRSGYVDSNIITHIYELKCESPVFSPISGVYTSDQTISLSCVTIGADIHYTDDGLIPSVLSPVYSTPIVITESKTFKAIASLSGYSDSDISEATYTLKCANPVFTPSQGIYTTYQSIQISSITVGSSVYYTTNGDDPDSSSTLYTTPIPIAATTNFKAIAIKTGYSDSNIISATHTINLPVNTPTFTPVAGTYTNSTMVTLSCGTPSVDIYYTVDGSLPDTNSILYTGNFSIKEPTTVRAFAVKYEHLDSYINTGFFNLKVANPTFNPSGGNYTSVNVELSCITPNARIFYTVDGLDPTINSIEYMHPIYVGNFTILKAIAVVDGFVNSDVVSERYTISQQTTTQPYISNPLTVSKKMDTIYQGR